jgi:hypothetical protein
MRVSATSPICYAAMESRSGESDSLETRGLACFLAAFHATRSKVLAFAFSLLQKKKVIPRV